MSLGIVNDSFSDATTVDVSEGCVHVTVIDSVNFDESVEVISLYEPRQAVELAALLVKAAGSVDPIATAQAVDRYIITLLELSACIRLNTQPKGPTATTPPAGYDPEGDDPRYAAARRVKGVGL